MTARVGVVGHVEWVRFAVVDHYPVPGEIVEASEWFDSFAAGVAFGLGAGYDLGGALEIGARCGAWCLTGRGPYGRQITAAELQGLSRQAPGPPPPV